jgi:hypothetical protein
MRKSRISLMRTIPMYSAAGAAAAAPALAPQQRGCRGASQTGLGRGLVHSGLTRAQPAAALQHQGHALERKKTSCRR